MSVRSQSESELQRTLPDGTVLAGAYQIVSLAVGLDGGQEYRARDLVLRREVTVCVAWSALASATLLEQARLLAQLAHPNLVRVYDVRNHDGLDVVVVEAIEAPSLREYVVLRGGHRRLDAREVVFVLAAIADALAALHRLGMVHAHLSADAVAITADRRVVLTQFLCAALDERSSRRDDAVERDLFALGTIGYELLLGGDTDGHGSISTAMDASGVSPALSRLIRGLLQGEGGRADATDLAHALRCLHAGAPLGPGRDVVIAHRDRKAGRRLGDALCRVAPGSTIRVVTTGPDVLAAVAKAGPDVLILDLDLPELNGVEVCMALPGAGQRGALRVCVTCAQPEAHRAVLERLGVERVIVPEALEDPAMVAAVLALPVLGTGEPTITVGGRYTLGRRLGQGGMGQVFEARHVLLNKRFALKLLSPALATDPTSRGRYLREAQLASTLSHPHLAQVVDYGRDPNLGPFLVMELLDGRSLAQLVSEPLSTRAACELLAQVAAALETLHHEGILHGDIKAENILVVEDTTERRRRVTKLLDFGLASRGAVALAAGERFAGTAEYFAPERVRGAGPSVGSDLYALGVLGYLLLTGELPFTGDTREVLRAQVTEPVPPLVAARGAPVDPELAQLITRALAKDPAERHPSIAAFRYQLSTAMHMIGIGPRRSRPSRIRGETERPGVAPAEPVTPAAAGVAGGDDLATQPGLGPPRPV